MSSMLEVCDIWSLKKLSKTRQLACKLCRTYNIGGFGIVQYVQFMIQRSDIVYRYLDIKILDVQYDVLFNDTRFEG